MSNLHPVFATICATFTGIPARVSSIQRDCYVKLLQRHDWNYEFSDDGSVYREGSDERKALSAIRRDIDPDAAIWNLHAPVGYQIDSCTYPSREVTLRIDRPESAVIAKRIKQLM